MNVKLSERQQQLLAAIIEQYAEVAAPVGSVILAKVFSVSPATIRAEMAKLEEKGLIDQPHTSAGRVPTDQGYRYYVNSLNNSSPLARSTDRGQQALERRVEQAGEPEQAIRSAVSSLVELTNNAAFALMGTNQYVSGLTQLFAQPEFTHSAAVHDAAYLLDHLDNWLREARPNATLKVYIGRENPIGSASGCTLIVSRFASPASSRSYVGVLGPTRQSYRRVMDLVARTGKLLEEELA